MSERMSERSAKPEVEKDTVLSGPQFIGKDQLQALIDVLKAEGFRVVAPTIDQNAIVYDEIESTSALPYGMSDTQGAGHYELNEDASGRWFHFNVGPHSWKKYLFPAELEMMSATSNQTDSDTSWEFKTPAPPTDQFAFLGVRSCELAAIAIQDKVFLGGPYVDRFYRARRERLFLIAVNCSTAADTCFCTTMGTGPKCEANFDLCLSELDEGFVVETGSGKGASVLGEVNRRPATAGEIELAAQVSAETAASMTRDFETDGLRDELLSQPDHPHWDDVASRCLSCTNCTMVCPTCFCSTVTDHSDLLEEKVARVRQWDSCFHLDFTYTADGVVRADVRSRYRQWLTHKFATWHDQFDSSGCVGCGRCITWCPVGIDVRKEIAAVCSQPVRRRSLPVVQPATGSACAVVKEES